MSAQKRLTCTSVLIWVGRAIDGASGKAAYLLKLRLPIFCLPGHDGQLHLQAEQLVDL